MLKFMRRNASGLWVKAIFSAIVLVFIFWGIGTRVNPGGRSRPVAMVNDRAIDTGEFQRAYANVARFYQGMLKDNFSADLMRTLDLPGKTIDQLIRNRLLQDEAARIGIEVSNEEVRDAIVAIPSFQQDGRFQKELYLRILKANRILPADFESAQREEIIVNRLQDLVMAPARALEGDARARFLLQNERVNLRFVEFRPTDFFSEATVTDAEVEEHYNANPSVWEEEPKVVLEYVAYPRDRFVEGVEVTEDEVRTYFDQNLARFRRPEQIRLRQILLKLDREAADETRASVRAKAENLLDTLRSGGDFGLLARKNSEDSASATKDGDMGSVTRGVLPPALEAVAFTLEAGSVSEIVETDAGLHLLKVEEKEASREDDLDAAREEILTTLRADKGKAAALRKAAEDHGRAANVSLAEIAKEAGLDVRTPPALRERDVEGGSVPAPVIRAAFAMEVAGTGPVVETAEEAILFRLVEKRPKQVPPLDQIRDRVTAEARLVAAARIAEQKGKEFHAKAAESGFEEAAKAAGLEEKETGPFAREGGFIQQIGPAADLKLAAFEELSAEKPLAPSVTMVGNRAVVAAFKERLAADESKFEEEKVSLLEQLEAERRNQIFEDFLQGLKAKAKVDIDTDYLASLGDPGTGGF